LLLYVRPNAIKIEGASSVGVEFVDGWLELRSHLCQLLLLSAEGLGSLLRGYLLALRGKLANEGAKSGEIARRGRGVHRTIVSSAWQFRQSLFARLIPRDA